MSQRPLRIAFIHPDLGIGGAERLVVDAAIGLQQLGHSVDIYTSYHDPEHCFEETRDGTVNVHLIKPPLPRSLHGKFHVLFAHLRQLHLTFHLVRRRRKEKEERRYDVYFVDQLATCVPFLRGMDGTRVVFYCHFPDKLLVDGAFGGGENEGEVVRRNVGLVKRIYRVPMDWLEEVTTRQADVILANSMFTARVFKSYFPSIRSLPRVVYPGINLPAYETGVDSNAPEVVEVLSSSPTLLSLNRFEGKKNIILALEAFSILLEKKKDLPNLRLVLAGGYDPRLEDNVQTLSSLVSASISHSLTYNIISPHTLPPSASSLLPPSKTWENNPPQILFLLNFTTSQRSALLQSNNTLVVLYTPVNEHFGIGPVEAMACGLPVLACDSGGPRESVVSACEERTGWLKEPDAEVWAETLVEICEMDGEVRKAIGECGMRRAREKFSMDAMARGLEEALREAERMGDVDDGLIEIVRVVVVMLVGFFLAYFASWFFMDR